MQINQVQASNSPSFKGLCVTSGSKTKILSILKTLDQNYIKSDVEFLSRNGKVDKFIIATGDEDISKLNKLRKAAQKAAGTEYWNIANQATFIKERYSTVLGNIPKISATKIVNGIKETKFDLANLTFFKKAKATDSNVESFFKTVNEAFATEKKDYELLNRKVEWAQASEKTENAANRIYH